SPPPSCTRPCSSPSAADRRPPGESGRMPAMSPQRQVLPTHEKVAVPRPTLSFSVPRRGKPPRDLADLTLAERVEALSELGFPGYRARQISTHYFEHLTRDAAAMTDLPATMRETAARELVPNLLSEVRRL